MYKFSHVLLALAAVSLAPAIRSASPDPQKTRELMAVVQSSHDLAVRARALQQLALVATKEAVPPLAALLGDEKLGQYARDVLEQMPDPAAGAALRDALGALKGNGLIGVVNSLGVRRDEEAVAALGRLAGGNAPELAGPALLALGRIATSDAMRLIEEQLSRGSARVRAAAAEACLLAAERQIAGGNNTVALTFYDKVRRAEVPLPLRVSATRGAISAAGAAGLSLLIEQLHAPDLAMRDMALLVIRETREPQFTPALVRELDRLGPEMQALLITALAERGENSALPGIEARAKTAEGDVQVAALRALGQIGRASSLPILLQAMSGPSSTAAASAARASLARIQTPETDAIVQGALLPANSGVRVALIGVLADRNASAATEGLMRLAGESDVEVSKAALRALGQLARPADLPGLIRLAVGIEDEAAKSLADRAIVTTSMKILHPERRADPVLAAFRGETNPTIKAALIRPLSAIVRSMRGSYDVFTALRGACQSGPPLVRAAALKALADWPDATPTHLLLAMLNEPNATADEREVALAGAIRMASVVAAGRERSPLNLVAVFAEAQRAVKTKGEKLMIISGLGNVRRPEALTMLQPYLDDPAVKAEASLAVVQIAPALLATKDASKVRLMLDTITATDQDETVRKKAAQLSRGGAGQVAKQKGKGRKANAVAAHAGGTPTLFNGQDLDGWDGDPAVWRVRDAAIVGGSLEGNPRNEFLATTRSYRNFVLRLEYKLVGTEGFVNGGVQFRSVRVAEPPNEMSGYQADIGAGHSGSLYDETRRKKFLARANAEQIKSIERIGDWNRYEIRCEGQTIALSLNGQKTLTFTEDDATVKPEGLIALQIHGNCKAEISFRNLELIELP